MKKPDFLTDLEQQTGYVAVTTKHLPKKAGNAKEHYRHAAANSEHFRYVDVADRVAFLTKNKYKITRENLIDPNLHDVVTTEAEPADNGTASA